MELFYLIEHSLPVIAISRITHTIEKMCDCSATLTGDPNINQMVQIDSRCGWSLNGIKAFGGCFCKNTIHSKPVSLMVRNGVSNFVSRVAVHAIMRPFGLRRRVIRQFTLIKIYPSSIAIPQCLVLLMMLNEKAVDGHVIAVYQLGLHFEFE